MAKKGLTMNIGQAASQSGLPSKTLRYYEEMGLVQPHRTEGNDYRNYTAKDVEHLRFLQCARSVGFSLDVCRELLELYRDENRRCSESKKRVLERIQQVETQLRNLHLFKDILTNIADGCVAEDSAGAIDIENNAWLQQSKMSFTLL